mmetsp:Transcript_22499/g.47601  ORF Transcript_22499/g.47601 Transcript_22499/m.47601 type:complete len:363 (+) Transcript_22499:650-1738(+)
MVLGVDLVPGPGHRTRHRESNPQVVALDDGVVWVGKVGLPPYRFLGTDLGNTGQDLSRRVLQLDVVPIGTRAARTAVNDLVVSISHVLQGIEGFNGSVRTRFVPRAHGRIEVVGWVQHRKGRPQGILRRALLVGRTDVDHRKEQKEGGKKVPRETLEHDQALPAGRLFAGAVDIVQARPSNVLEAVRLLQATADKRKRLGELGHQQHPIGRGEIRSNVADTTGGTKDFFGFGAVGKTNRTLVLAARCILRGLLLAAARVVPRGRNDGIRLFFHGRGDDPREVSFVEVLRSEAHRGSRFLFLAGPDIHCCVTNDHYPEPTEGYVETVQPGVVFVRNPDLGNVKDATKEAVRAPECVANNHNNG